MKGGALLRFDEFAAAAGVFAFLNINTCSMQYNSNYIQQYTSIYIALLSVRRCALAAN